MANGIPTPNDIADGRAKRSKTVISKLANTLEFYDSPITGVKYSLLNSVWPPSVQEIGDYQMSQIRARMEINPSLQKIAERLSADITVSLGGEDQSVETALSSIEQALSFQEEGSAAQLSKITQTAKLDNLIVLYNNVIDKLKKVDFLIKDTKAAINGTQLKVELDRVDQTMEAIEQELNTMKSSTDAIYNVSGTTISYLKKAEWLGRRLKGKYFEVVGTKWIAKKVPRNIKVVNVGKVLGPTINIFGESVGSNKMIRTDIMGFDISQNITINFTIGAEKQQMSMNLIDFLSYMEKNGETTTISFTEQQLQVLQQALVFGVQAKAGKNQAIFNPTTVTLEEAIATEGTANCYARNLYLLTYLVKEAPWIAKTHDYYNAMFNWCLAKGLTNIIGKDNSLVLTRSGVKLMRDYLLEQWTSGSKYVQAKSHVHVDNPTAGVTVVYSSAGTTSKN